MHLILKQVIAVHKPFLYPGTNPSYHSIQNYNNYIWTSFTQFGGRLLLPDTECYTRRNPLPWSRVTRSNVQDGGVCPRDIHLGERM